MEKELEKIAAIMYDTASTMTCNIYDGHGLPICSKWASLSKSEQATAISGLKSRIEREGLLGYFNRKSREVPTAAHIYMATIQKLKEQGLL